MGERAKSLFELQILGPKKEDLTGKRFGRLTVIGFDSRDKSRGDVYWKCKCDCGTEKIVAHFALTYNRTISCGCLQKERSSARIKAGQFKAYDERRVNRDRVDVLIKPLYSLYKFRAKKKGRDFTLSLEEFKALISSNCFYCGKIPSTVHKVVEYAGSMLYNGVDRVDNTKGYTQDNSVTCCEACNRAKLEMQKSEFYSWIEAVYINLKNKGEL